jgi:hypothetical protein
VLVIAGFLEALGFIELGGGAGLDFGLAGGVFDGPAGLGGIIERGDGPGRGEKRESSRGEKKKGVSFAHGSKSREC